MIQIQRTTLLIAGVAIVLAVVQTADAQQGGRRGFGRGFGTVSEAQLASLEQVQEELKLNDEQKSKVTSINEKLRTERRELFQGANQENRAERGEQLAKLNAEATSQVQAALDDAQKKRLRELWIQVAGAAAALDNEEIAKELKVTDDQKRELERVSEANLQAAREAFQGFGDLSPEQRTEKLSQFRRESNERALAVLTPEQREQFATLQGKKVEIDTAPLFQRRRDT
jgi:Spy/CpxP family protein refolding chaperone